MRALSGIGPDNATTAFSGVQKPVGR